jgi:WD40 repeat protein
MVTARGSAAGSKAHVFISYSRSDMAFADRLEAGLKERGFMPLIDRTEIYAFEDWWKRIQTLIVQADTIIFVLSPNSVSSDICRKEIAFAATLNKRFAPIVCRRIETAAMPSELSRFNFIFFDDESSFEASFDKLVEALSTDIEWIRKHTEFGEQARRWWDAGQPRGLLLRSPVLEEAEGWIGSRPANTPAPTDATQAFIAQSRRAVTRRQRLTLAVSLIAAIIGFVLAGLAYWQRGIAIDARNDADRNAETARVNERRALAELRRAQRNESRSLAEQSLHETASGNAVRGMRLALSALPNNPVTPDRPFVSRAEFALAKAIVTNRLEYAATPTQDWINSASFNTDGSHIAIGTRDGVLKLLDSASGQEIRSSQDRRQAVLALAYSFDGSFLATAHQNPPSVLVRDAKSGTVIWDFRVNVSPQYLLFTPDSSHIIAAAGLQDVRPHIWNLKTGAQATMSDVAARGINSIAVSPDGGLLALATYWDNGLFVWDINTSTLLASYQVNANSPQLKATALDFSKFEENEEIYKAQFARSAGVLILAGKRTLYQIDPRTRAIIHNWRFADEWIVPRTRVLLVSSDGTRAVIAASNTELKVYSLIDGQQVARYTLSSPISAAQLSADDRLLSAAGEDSIVRVWDLNSNTEVSVLSTTGTRGLVFAPDGARLLSFGDKTAHIWDVRDELTRLSPLPPGSHIESVNSAGTRALVALPRIRSTPDIGLNPEPTVLWDLQRSIILNQEKWSSDWETTFLSNTDDWILRHKSFDLGEAEDSRKKIETELINLRQLVGGDATLPLQIASRNRIDAYQVVEAESGRTKRVLITQANENAVKATYVSSDGSRLGLSWDEYNDDGVESQSWAEVWDLDQQKKQLEIVQSGHNAKLWFSADNKKLVVVTELKLRQGYGRFTHWDLTNATNLSDTDQPLGNLDVMRLPDGRDRIAVGNKETRPLLMELSSGREIGNVAGNALGVSQVAISQDRQHLLIENVGALRSLWHIPSRTRIAIIPGPNARTSTAAFTDDGRRILATSRNAQEATVEVFDSDSGRRLRQIGPMANLLDSYAGLTGAYVVVQTSPATIEIYDVDSETVPRHINLKERLHRWRFVSADARLVTVDESGRLQIWDPRTGEEVFERDDADNFEPLGGARLDLHRVPVLLSNGRAVVLDTDSGQTLWQSSDIKANTIDLAPDGKSVVVRSAPLVEVFDVKTGKAIESLPLAPDQKLFVNFSGDGQRVFLDLRGGTSVLFDLGNKREIGRYNNVELSVLSRDNPTMALSSANKLQIIDGTTGEVRQEAQFQQPIRMIEIDDSGISLAAVTAEQKIIAIDVKSGSQHEVASTRRFPSWIKFGPNGGELIIYEDSGDLKLHDVKSGAVLTAFPSQWPETTNSFSWMLRVDPTAKFIGVRSPDNYVRIFRAADGSTTSNFNWDDRTFADLLFSSSGERLVLATEKGDILIWNTLSMKSEHMIHLEREYSIYQESALRRTNDTSHVLAVDKQGRVDLISLSTFDSRLFFSGRPEDQVNASLSDDGRFLAVMGTSGVLRLWDVGARDVLLEVPVTNQQSYSSPDLRVVPGGRFLIAQARNQPPHLLQLPPTIDELVGTAKQTLTRAPAANDEVPAQQLRLGVSMSDLSRELAASRHLYASEGALVTEVIPDSAAAAVGIRVGDIISQIDGKPVRMSGDVAASVKAAGADLTLLLLRGSQSLTVKVYLGD